MANEQNLLKAEDLTPKERRENARKAGIASGKARREKRDRKQRAAELFDLTMQGAGVEKIKKFFNINEIIHRTSKRTSRISIHSIRNAILTLSKN